MNFKTGTIIALTFCTFGLVAINTVFAQTNEEDQPTIAAESNLTDLSGIWILDNKASDNLKDIFAPSRSRQMGSRGGSLGGGMRGGRGGGLGGGGRGGQPNMGNDSSGAKQERMMKNMEVMQKELSRLEIFQTDHEFNVTDGMDISRLIITDGRKNIIWTRQGKATATAEWNAGILKVNINSEGQKRGNVRHYTLSEDGSKLVVLQKKSMGQNGEPKTIRLVYRKN